MNAVVSPSAGLGKAVSGTAGAKGLVSTGTTVFLRRWIFTALDFRVFTAITGVKLNAGIKAARKFSHRRLSRASVR
jgi:hypothetical protein